MSEEDAKAFLKKVGEDKELQGKLKGADSEEKFFALAKASGFDFTKDEWLSVVPKEKDSELSDTDLAQAAGGDTEWIDYLAVHVFGADPLPDSAKCTWQPVPGTGPDDDAMYITPGCLDRDGGH